MRAPELFRTQAFRIVLIYLFVFAASASALMAFVYWNTTNALDSQTDQTIENEVLELSDQYQRHGIRSLAELVIARSIHGGQGLYVLADSQHRVIAGNLDSWPGVIGNPGHFVEFDYERRSQVDGERRRARGQVLFLAGGFELLAAQDVHERYLIEKFFTTTLPYTVGLILLLGFGGGILLSRRMLQRLDSINRTASEIMGGDLSRRVVISGAHDEFDALAENLNAMLDRIERLMRGVQEVADSVAHDLRTPLTRLRNRLEAISRHAANGESTEIEAAIAETDRLIATFNGLLLIAEADAGIVREAMTTVDLTSVGEDILELYAPLADENGIDLGLQPSGSITIEGNRSLVSQALANLVDNAIKYTPKGGKVTIAISERAVGAEISVSDTGPGIPPEHRIHVVERFVRLEASRSSPGTGLGLALVAAVSRLHGAVLILEDNKPGLKAIIRFSRSTRPIPHPPSMTERGTEMAQAS